MGKLHHYVLMHTHRHGSDAVPFSSESENMNGFLNEEPVPGSKWDTLLNTLGIDFEPDREEVVEVVSVDEPQLLTEAGLHRATVPVVGWCGIDPELPVVNAEDLRLVKSPDGRRFSAVPVPYDEKPHLMKHSAKRCVPCAFFDCPCRVPAPSNGPFSLPCEEKSLITIDGVAHELACDVTWKEIK